MVNNESKENKNENYLEYLDNLSNNIIDYVSEETGIKVNKEENTVLLKNVEINNDGTVKFSINTEKYKKAILDYIRDYGTTILVGVAYAVLLLMDFLVLKQTVNAIYFLDLEYLKITIPKFFMLLAFSAALWVYSTGLYFWQFHNRKKLNLYISIGSIVIHLFSLLYKSAYILLIPSISKIEINELMTINKLIGLGRFATTVPTIAITALLILSIIKGISKEEIQRDIENFKITHHIKKPISPYEYSLSVVRDLKTGRKIVIPEHDRMLHGEITGATGTGKTSSVLLQMIYNDLKIKAKNVDAQKKAIYKMLKQGKIYIDKPFEDKDFNPNMINTIIHPKPNYEKEFKKKVLRYKSAGITVMAPDCSMTDKVCDLAEAFGFDDYNRIDPLRTDDGGVKKNDIGCNPLYISPLIPEWAITKELIKKATLCADVMQIMYEMSGKSDPYFSSVNRIATTAAAMAVMIAHPLVFPGESPKLSYVRDIINDFNRINVYVPTLKRINKEQNNKYGAILSVIENEFLGPGKEQFSKHCNGLRNQLNNFLMHTEVERVLCSDNTIDMDRMLEEGQITTVNFELGDLGPINSPAFGLFITINLINAVLRRKGDEWTRLPHFWYIDELPVIVCPAMEQCFSLFRKYRTSMTVALQTLDQMNKNPFLMYLKGIILNSCGFHIVFGRTNPNDQEVFSRLSGMVDKVIYTQSSNSTSLMVDNPSYSTQDRYTVQQVARTSETEIRNRDFQEVTFFYVDNGRAVAPKAGKVEFLKDKHYEKKKRLRFNWSELIANCPTASVSVDNIQNRQQSSGSVMNDADFPHDDALSQIKFEDAMVIDDNMPITETKPLTNVDIYNDKEPVKEAEAEGNVLGTIDDETDEYLMESVDI